MTINYSSKVVSCKGFGSLWRLAFRWKGSVYKLIWPDMILFTICYFSLSAVYRFCLSEDQKRVFEMVSMNVGSFTDKIPVAFVLGFYVSIVIQRWWAQFENIPWPDALSILVSSSILGSDEGGRLLRRQILRYMNLGMTLSLNLISPAVKGKYSTTTQLVESGFLTRSEKKILDVVNSKTSHSVYWLPMIWAACLVKKARKEGRISDDITVNSLLHEINRIRGLCGTLLCYEWISIPLVYTQIVTIAVWSFFISTLMGRQFLDPAQGYPNNRLDYIVPIFTYVEFLVYIGWLKVAETLVNPFGEDDDDFEILYVIERNLEISYMMSDEFHDTTPCMVRDLHWDDMFVTKNKNLFNPDGTTGAESPLSLAGSPFDAHLCKDFLPHHFEGEGRLPVMRSYSQCTGRGCSSHDWAKSPVDSLTLPCFFPKIQNIPQSQGYPTWPSIKDPRREGSGSRYVTKRERLCEPENEPRVLPEKLDAEGDDVVVPSDRQVQLFDIHQLGKENNLMPASSDGYASYKV